MVNMISVIVLAQIAVIYANKASRAASPPATKDTCPSQAKADLVKCLTKSLNEWSFKWYIIRHELEKLDCKTHESISKCWTGSNCSLKDAIRYSTALTDLLVFKRVNATYIHGVLALDPICEDRNGPYIMKEHMECLKAFHEGEKVISTVDSIHSDLQKNEIKEADLCQKLTAKGKAIQAEVKTHCQSDVAALLICKAISTPFLKLKADVLSNCEPCQSPQEDKASVKTVDPTGSSKPNGDPKKRMAANSYHTQSLVAILLTGFTALLAR